MRYSRIYLNLMLYVILRHQVFACFSNLISE